MLLPPATKKQCVLEGRDAVLIDGEDQRQQPFVDYPGTVEAAVTARGLDLENLDRREVGDGTEEAVGAEDAGGDAGLLTGNEELRRLMDPAEAFDRQGIGGVIDQAGDAVDPGKL